MKNIRLLRHFALIACMALLGIGAHAQLSVSSGPVPNTPNTKAILDLTDAAAGKRGLLIPRMTSAQRAAIASPANSLLVYQTDSVGTMPPGFCYYDGTPGINQWFHVTWGLSWKLGGNTNTNPATDFIGTTNAQPLIIETNGVQRAQLTTGAQLQIGTSPFPAATEKLDVNGAVKIAGTSAPVATEGAIRFNATSNMHEGYVNNPLGGGQIQYVGWYELENVFKTRVKQKYQSTPVVACNYPAPVSVPNGGTNGSWPTLDDATIANNQTASTLETPYSTFWEDGRHQYLYTSAQMQALNVCPGTDIKGVAFQAASAGTAPGMRNVRIKLKNTNTPDLSAGFINGCQTYYSVGNYGGGAVPDYTVVNGWNAHVFNVPPNFQWTGPGFNMVVEYCFDNQDWTSNTPIYYEPVSYNAMFGLYCDACGNPFGSATCYYNAGPCNGTGTGSLPPTGVPSNTTGVQCIGWGWGGTAGGGCAWDITTTLLTCDATFQYQGAFTAAQRRPILKIDAQVNASTTLVLNGSYILAQDAVMIGDYNTWAKSSLYAYPNYRYHGPGTLSAYSSVWGGSVLLSDHVFDQYFDGIVKPEDAKQALGYQHYGVKDMAKYMEREHHLPTLDGRDEWNKDGFFSLDHLTNQLWVTVEEQSLYIKELHERMDALQKYLVEKRLNELKKN